jgi:hypothetical protein
MIRDNWLYNVSVWVLIPEGGQPSKIKLTVQTDAGGKTNWIEIAHPVSVTPGEWKEIKGKYQHTGTFDTVSLYVECLGNTQDFYIDDIKITGHDMGSS